MLTGLLKPGGYFRVGLYSELARRHIVAARHAVAQKGFPPTLDGIRACRAYVLGLPPDDPVRATLLASPDFYTASALRDLVFHVQEHRLTLPQIKDMMQRLQLECLGFTIATADIMNKYDSAFPGDRRRTNIDNWATFEKNNPDTFGAMYQFWCRKTG